MSANAVAAVRNTVFIAIASLTFTDAVAAPPENTDPSLEPWFNSLSAADGTSCCKIADCRPTKSHFAVDGYEALIDEMWIPVPWDRVLPRANQSYWASRRLRCATDHNHSVFRTTA